MVLITDDKKDVMYMELTYKTAKEHPDLNRNKAVGAVIVKDGRVVTKGWRWTANLWMDPLVQICFHAEHMALLKADSQAEGATLYVTMEPCTHRVQSIHFPSPVDCVTLITSAKIARVVFGIRDEYSTSVARLTQAGIEVAQAKIDEERYRKLTENPWYPDETAKKATQQFNSNIGYDADG